MNGQVTVIIPTKNRPVLATRAIQSALAQTYPDVEVLVIDDGSVPPFQCSFIDTRVRVIRLDESRGGASARNVGIENSHGKYVCFLDDDDLYLPDKLEKQVAYLDQHPDVDLVFSKVILKGKDSEAAFLADDFLFTVETNFKLFNVIHMNATLFRRHALDGLRFDERLRKFQDMQFHLLATLSCKTHFLPMNASIWHVDERLDQVSRVRGVAEFESFEILTRSFWPIIEQFKLQRRYLAKLAMLALQSGRKKEAYKYSRQMGPVTGVVAWFGIRLLNAVPVIDSFRSRLGFTTNRLG